MYIKHIEKSSLGAVREFEVLGISVSVTPTRTILDIHTEQGITHEIRLDDEAVDRLIATLQLIRGTICTYNG